MPARRPSYSSFAWPKRFGSILRALRWCWFPRVQAPLLPSAARRHPTVPNQHQNQPVILRCLPPFCCRKAQTTTLQAARASFVSGRGQWGYFILLAWELPEACSPVQVGGSSCSIPAFGRATAGNAASLPHPRRLGRGSVQLAVAEEMPFCF